MKSNIDVIKNLLKNTDKKMTEIAELCGVSSRTVQNINNGKTHKKPDEIYPIRATGKRLSDLKGRLSVPRKEAVPRPHVLSPQLIDYIGFLSLLGVGEEAILEFREVFYEELKCFFNRDLSNDEILSIIKLRPSKPETLSDLVKAYDKPRVRFMNLGYWLETGLIKPGEEEFILSMF